MTNYDNVQLVAYGTPTSAPIQVLPDYLPGPASPPDKGEYDADMKLRATTLCKVADWIRTDHSGAVSDPSTLKVLVVPEFYFRFGGPALKDEGDRRGTDTDTLHNSYPYPQAVNLIATVMEEILKPHFNTESWKDWLIVAGSVFWHVPPDQTLDGSTTYLNTLLVINGGPHATQPASSDRVPTMGTGSTNQKALMSRIDWSLDEDRSAWDARLNPMFKEILGDNQYLRWHQFKADGKNNGSGEPVVFGVEVCLEHLEYGAAPRPDLGVLRLMHEVRPTLPVPTVQVVTGCGSYLNPETGIVTERGGANLICDGMKVDIAFPYTWPRAEATVTEDVAIDGGRQMTNSAPIVGAWDIPANLQVGAGIYQDPRTPLDKVAVFDPIPLA